LRLLLISPEALVIIEIGSTVSLIPIVIVFPENRLGALMRTIPSSWNFKEKTSISPFREHSNAMGKI